MCRKAYFTIYMKEAAAFEVWFLVDNPATVQDHAGTRLLLRTEATMKDFSFILPGSGSV